MDHGIATAAGAGGILITQEIFNRVDYFADKPAYRAAAELAVGLGVGYGLYRYAGQPAAFGFLGGVGGLALATLAQSGTTGRVPDLRLPDKSSRTCFRIAAMVSHFFTCEERGRMRSQGRLIQCTFLLGRSGDCGNRERRRSRLLLNRGRKVRPPNL